MSIVKGLRRTTPRHAGGEPPAAGGPTPGPSARAAETPGIRAGQEAPAERTRAAAGAAPVGDPGRAREAAPAVWPVVAGREIHVRLTDKNFLISTISTLVIMIASFAIQGIIAGHETVTHLVVTDQKGAELGGAIGAAVHGADEKASIDVRPVAADATAARAQLESGQADVWLHQEQGTWTLTTKDSPTPAAIASAAASVVRQDAIARNAAAAGSSADAILAGSTVATTQLNGEKQDQLVQTIAGMTLAVIFYMVSLLFGMAIAQSVVEEKQSRIVEIIASAIPLRQLLVGKVLGNTALAMGQIVLFVSVCLLGLQLTPYSSYVAMIGGPVAWFVAFFLVGFVALAALWAVAGSLASRHEDLQTTSQPMMLLVMIAFMGGAFSSGAVRTVLSFIPVCSGVAMPMRLLGESLPWWQPVLSLAINLAFAVVVVMVGERAYRHSIMADGGRVSWAKALRARD